MSWMCVCGHNRRAHRVDYRGISYCQAQHQTRTGWESCRCSGFRDNENGDNRG